MLVICFHCFKVIGYKCILNITIFRLFKITTAQKGTSDIVAQGSMPRTVSINAFTKLFDKHL